MSPLVTRNGGRDTAGHVPEPVVVRRARVLDPPIPADDPPIRVAHAGIRADAVHDPAQAKTPAGVVLSPSRRRAETPRAPSHARHGPATATQHSPSLRQRRSDPRYDQVRAPGP